MENAMCEKTTNAWWAGEKRHYSRLRSTGTDGSAGGVGLGGRGPTAAVGRGAVEEREGSPSGPEDSWMVCFLPLQRPDQPNCELICAQALP